MEHTDVRQIPAQEEVDQPLEHAIGLYTQGKVSESEQAFTQLASSPKDAAEAYYWLGVIHLRAGDPAGASSLLHNALAQNPNNANALSIMGTIAERQNQMEDARAYYSRALAINPGLTSTQQRLTALAQAPSRAAPKRRGWLGRVVNILILVIFLAWFFLSYSVIMAFNERLLVDAVLTVIAARAFISLFPIRQR